MGDDRCNLTCCLKVNVWRIHVALHWTVHHYLVLPIEPSTPGPGYHTCVALPMLGFVAVRSKGGGQVGSSSVGNSIFRASWPDCG